MLKLKRTLFFPIFCFAKEAEEAEKSTPRRNLIWSKTIRWKVLDFPHKTKLLVFKIKAFQCTNYPKITPVSSLWPY